MKRDVNGSGTLTGIGNDRALRDAFVAQGRTCERKPRPVYAASYYEASPWRPLLRTQAECLAASGGKALPDILGFYGEMARTVIVMAGAEQPRDLRDALREEAASDAACDALEMEVALAPSLANVEALMACSRDLIRKTEAKLVALQQTRDALLNPTRRVAA